MIWSTLSSEAMNEFVKFVVKVFLGAATVAAGGKLIKNGLDNASRVKFINRDTTVDNQ